MGDIYKSSKGFLIGDIWILKGDAGGEGSKASTIDEFALDFAKIECFCCDYFELGWWTNALTLKRLGLCPYSSWYKPWEGAGKQFTEFNTF